MQWSVVSKDELNDLTTDHSPGVSEAGQGRLLALDLGHRPKRREGNVGLGRLDLLDPLATEHAHLQLIARGRTSVGGDSNRTALSRATRLA